MTIRRVWAPRASKLDLVVDGKRLAMSRDDDDWWSVEVPVELARADYAYSIDDGDPVPDPRSPWQPHGQHGFSRPIEHSEFAWTDADWQQAPLSSAIIYECHPGTFTEKGTFDSAIERLDYLRDLGVTHLELMPVNQFPGSRGWGYDGVDLYAPHSAYGDPQGMKRLVDECHQRRIAVILDVVYNHFGPDGNYLARFGSYLTTRYATPWGDAVNLDGEESAEVRRFFCDNALMWLRDYHVDALRIDAIHAIFDASAIHFLEQLASEVNALEAHLGRHLYAIAESDLNSPRVVTPREAGGYGLDAQWNDDFHHALHAILTGERNGYYQDFGSIGALAKSLTDVFVYDGNYSRFRRRNHGKTAIGLAGDRFVGFLQNHDQVGNRAKGERLGHLVSLDRLKIAAGILMTAPFIPMLFQGEEWNASSPFQYFTDHSGELGEAVREGRRRQVANDLEDLNEVPDPQSPITFERSKLKWDELTSVTHAEVLSWYRELIHLRRRISDLSDGRNGSTAAEFDETERWIHIRRGEWSIVCNLAESPQQINIGPPLVVVMASKEVAPILDGHIQMPAVSVAILAPASALPKQ